MTESLWLRAERALLGAVLSDPVGQQHALDLVDAGDMTSPWHGQVLEAMQRLCARGGLPGPEPVYQEIQRDPDLPRIVAHDAVPIFSLMQATPRAEHAGAYAAIVVEGGIRRQLDLAGGRLIQAGESGDLENALWQGSQARRTVAACVARWLALPEQLRREAVQARPDRSPVASGVGRAAAVQEEGKHRRADGRAGRALAGEQGAAIAVDPGLVGAAPGREAVARRAAREEAGLAALRDLADGPSHMGRVRGWLRPEHFASPGHGAVYALMRDMDAAGQPIDPVTVCWEAARCGFSADPDTLAGGTSAFAAVSARTVYQLGLLAQAAQTGRDIQADAADLSCLPRHLLLSAHERLRALEMARQPQAWPGQDAEAARQAGRSAAGQQAVQPEREAVP